MAVTASYLQVMAVVQAGHCTVAPRHDPRTQMSDCTVPTSRCVAGDLEAVSHRLVALAKEQSSQDNISVVVVFLASPEEVVRRHVMETASPPDPFVSRNGADTMFRNGVEDEDFGPETDVDLVDDVLMSPTIAAAKALVAGCQDDHERQRQQMADFDDPADLDPRRDTPTPPAHEGEYRYRLTLPVYLVMSRHCTACQIDLQLF